jgi:hypothetical protein
MISSGPRVMLVYDEAAENGTVADEGVNGFDSVR